MEEINSEIATSDAEESFTGREEEDEKMKVKTMEWRQSQYSLGNHESYMGDFGIVGIQITESLRERIELIPSVAVYGYSDS